MPLYIFDTNLSATISPKFTTSKILVQVSQGYLFVNNTSTQMQANIYICDGDNNILDGRIVDYDMLRVKNQICFAGTHSAQLLHSPNTTSPFTYRVYGNNYSNSGSNTTTLQCHTANRTNTFSTMTLMEIAQ